MEYRFWDWLSCPASHERDDVKLVAYGTDIALECYECGQQSEYAIGTEDPVHELDVDAIVEAADEG